MPPRGLLTRFLDGEATLDSLLQKIREREPQLHCWVQMRPEESVPEGPLQGLPYGLKDIFSAAGYLTCYGSPLYAGNVTAEDAELVTLLRSRGARLMGKTQTTAFAYYDPAPTRNPHRTSHTPGGSSSGSAAAVAAGMVPFAIGSQTQGSVVRPASFCGVVGFKPTHKLLPMGGCLPFAPTLDTGGFFTQTALDMRALWERIGFAVDADPPQEYGWIEFSVDEAMQAAMLDSVLALGSFGFKVRRIQPPASFLALMDAVPWVNKYEGARTHEQRYRDHGNAIGLKLAQLVRDGLAIPEARYQEALETIRLARLEMVEVFAAHPVILTPAAPGAAPAGLASTGDPRCNSPWTALGVPALTIPMRVGEELPLGMQMSAAANNEALLLAAACQCQALLNAPTPAAD